MLAATQRQAVPHLAAEVETAHGSTRSHITQLPAAEGEGLLEHHARGTRARARTQTHATLDEVAHVDSARGPTGLARSPQRDGTREVAGYVVIAESCEQSCALGFGAGTSVLENLPDEGWLAGRIDICRPSVNCCGQRRAAKAGEWTDGGDQYVVGGVQETPHRSGVCSIGQSGREASSSL